MAEWIRVCDFDEIDQDDVARFDHGDQTFAIYRALDDTVWATDGLCTHEKVHLAEGLVMDDVIECPMHNGRFNFRTGEALRVPACENLATYPARVRDGVVEIEI